jgi:hypothetical protein
MKEVTQMKRRLLLISLTLVLVLTALTPATALAHQGKYVKTENFSGSGLIYVTYMPEPIIKGKVWRYQGEIVEGYLAQCEWDLLAGTAFYSEHDSVVRVSDDGSAQGVMKGTFSLTRPDGGVLKGTFTGKIRGNLYTGDISDAGSWRSTGGTGVFEGVRASGKWSADLSFGPIPDTDIYTLVGPVTWQGKYNFPKTQNIIKPGKPIKPWKQFPIKPGKPIKPWKPITPGKP